MNKITYTIKNILDSDQVTMKVNVTETKPFSEIFRLKNGKELEVILYHDKSVYVGVEDSCNSVTSSGMIYTIKETEHLISVINEYNTRPEQKLNLHDFINPISNKGLENVSAKEGQVVKTKCGLIGFICYTGKNHFVGLGGHWIMNPECFGNYEVEKVWGSLQAYYKELLGK